MPARTKVSGWKIFLGVDLKNFLYVDSKSLLSVDSKNFLSPSMLKLLKVQRSRARCEIEVLKYFISVGGNDEIF